MLKIKDPKILFYLFFTLVNVLLAIMFFDIRFFLIRQASLTIFSGFLVLFNADVDIIKDDLNLVNKLLIKRCSFFEYESVLTFLMPVCAFLLSTRIRTFFFLYCIVIFFCVFYFILLSYKAFLVLTVPEIRRLIFWPKKASIRFIAHTIIKICLEFTKYVAAGFLCFYGCFVMWPKLFHGFSYRGSVVNYIGYQFTGLKTHHELLYFLALYHLSEYPDEKAFITKSDGCTIAGGALIQRIAQKNFGYMYFLNPKK